MQGHILEMNKPSLFPAQSTPPKIDLNTSEIPSIIPEVNLTRENSTLPDQLESSTPDIEIFQASSEPVGENVENQDPDEDDLMETLRHINLIQLEPEDLFVVNVSISTLLENWIDDCSALVDSGARMNLVHESLVRHLGVNVVPHACPVKGLGKKNKHVTKGIVNLSLNIHGLQSPACRFHVVGDNLTDYPVILGYEFLKDTGIRVDCSRQRLQVLDPELNTLWELYVGSNGKPCQQVLYAGFLSVVRDCTLHSSDMTLVKARLDIPEYMDLEHRCQLCRDVISNLWYDGMPIGLPDATAIPGIINQGKEDISVLVDGRSMKSKRVKKGTILGKIYTLCEPAPPVVSHLVQGLDDRNVVTDDPRIEAIQHIKLASDLSKTQTEQFQKILYDHLPVISRGDEDVGECRSSPIHIELHDETPIYQRVRRFPQPVAEAIEKQCLELQDLGIIEPSMSPWSSPVVPVIKPDGTIRLCIDYRRLNKITKSDKFPMPNLSDTVFSLHGVKYFTTLDMVRGYYQLPLAEDSKEYTAFSMVHGHWQFRRLSFGLKNAPAVFQREMQRMLSDFPKAKVIVYIDDILILGSSFEEHLQLVSKVMEVLLLHGLKVKMSKCSWAQSEVRYLGHLISRRGVKKLPEYVEKIENFPKPENVRELRGFLGLINFQRKFIPDCSVLMKPLTQYTGGRKSQGKNKIPWTPEMNEAFLKLKEVLKEEVNLSFPQYSPNAEPLELYVDASGSGAGACLCQMQENKRVVIGYDSMTFEPAQKKYSAIERELAALRWGIKAFRPFVYGQFFILYSDHKPLMYLQDTKMIDSRLARTLEELSEFNFIVRYCPGKNNGAADTFSRLPNQMAELPTCDLSDQGIALPRGLTIYKTMDGGGDSMIEALRTSLQFLYKKGSINIDEVPSNADLRHNMVDLFLREAKRYGLLIDKSSSHKVKAMKYPGCLPAIELLLAFTKLYNIEVWVHFGGGRPIVYKDPDITCNHRIHLQCLGGVHFNPLMELQSYSSPVHPIIATIPEVAPAMMVSEVLIPDKTAPGPIAPENTPILCCSHFKVTPPACIVRLNGHSYCGLVDMGSQVSLACNEIVNDQILESQVRKLDGEENLQGIGGNRSRCLGEIELTLSLLSGHQLAPCSFALVSGQDMDFCFLLGKNIISKSRLVLDAKHDCLYYGNENVASLGIPMPPAVQESPHNSLVMSISLDLGLKDHASSTLLTSDQLYHIQQDCDQIRTIIRKIVSSEEPFRLPKSCSGFRLVQKYLVLQDDLLYKQNKDGTLVGIISFKVLIDLTAKIHLEYSHIGIHKTVGILKQHVWHPSLHKVVKDMCRTCSVCQKKKVSRITMLPPTVKIFSSSPFELVAVDLISLPTTSRGFIACVVMVDHFSKWVAAIPIKNKRSDTIIDVLESRAFTTFPRLPRKVLTDNGPEFISQNFADFLDKYNIHHIRTTPYRPQSNGAVERVNRTIGQFLRVLSDDPKKWDQNLARTLMTYNHTIHSETSDTPANMILKIKWTVWDVPLLSKQQRAAWAEGHPRYSPFRPGRLVLKKVQFTGNLTTSKLLARYEGPYEVTKFFSNNVTYELVSTEDGSTIRAHHMQLRIWHEPPKYLKRHFQYYSTATEIETVLTTDHQITDLQPPFSDSSESDEWSPHSAYVAISRHLSYPYEHSNSFLLPQAKRIKPENTINKLPSPPKSILKPARTYETRLRERLAITEAEHSRELGTLSSETGGSSYLEMVDSPQIASTVNELNPLLTEKLNISNEISSTHYLSSTTLTGYGVILGDWELSSIEFDFPEIATNTLDGDTRTQNYYRLVHITPDSWEDLPPAPLVTSSPIQSAEVWKKQSTSESLQQEISHIRVFNDQNHVDNSFRESQVQEKANQISGSFDFSGFASQLNYSKISGRQIGATKQTRTKSTVSPRTTRKLSLSPIKDTIKTLRNLVQRSRENARARNLSARRRLSFLERPHVPNKEKKTYLSPPQTRSRGRALDLPYVQPMILERQLKKTENA